MAVFTVVSDQQLKDWLAQYDAGELLAIEPIASGIENTNYFVDTNIFFQKQAVCFQTTYCFIIYPTTEIITKFPPALHPNDKYSHLDKAVRNPARTEHTGKKIPASSGGI